MKNIALNIDKTAGFIAEGAVKAYAPKVQEALEMLEKGNGLGNDFLGWLHLPSSITEEHLNDIQETANTLRELCDVVVVAVSVVVPDLEILMTPNFLSLRNSVSSKR